MESQSNDKIYHINGKGDEPPITNELTTNGSSSTSSSSSSSSSFSFSSHPTLEGIRQIHAKFCSDRNWDQYHTPRNVLLALVGEIGELAELFQWKGEVSIGLKEWPESERKCVEQELSDCLIYLVRLADRCKIDLPKAVIEKFEMNADKYPIEKVYGSSKKYTEYQKDHDSDKNGI